MSAGPVYASKPWSTRGRICEIDRILVAQHRSGDDVVFRERWLIIEDDATKRAAAAQAANRRAWEREQR